MGRNYSPDFKKSIVEKIVGPGGRSATAVGKEIGIASSTISYWVRQHQELALEKVCSNGKRPRDWSNEEKFNALVETSKMSEEDLGAYLRREGLHAVHLKEFKEHFLKNLTENARRKEIAEQRKKNKELEKEIRRKDKALAEATALLVLKKKAELIWGVVEEEEPV